MVTYLGKRNITNRSTDGSVYNRLLCTRLDDSSGKYKKNYSTLMARVLYNFHPRER